METAKSFSSQTGWRSSGPLALCQDNAFLVKVSEYSFDLADSGFVECCARRGILHSAGAGKRFEFTARHGATEAEFMRSFAVSESGKYTHTADEMRTHWRIMLASKGAFQQCWELYRKEAARANDASIKKPAAPEQMEFIF